MLERVKQTFFWQNFKGYKDKFDDDGQLLGTFPEYSETQSARANISAAKGTAEQEMFGALLEYDRTIAVKFPLDMDEHSLVWLDGAEPPKPHNYIVVRKSQSGNYTVFALQRVELSGEPDEESEGGDEP
ncbi:MAG: hypothetical protein NC299_11960 [Lachnospiraceae bacterium]|nr:hypothetical protein [Lachnospiraceae bacterium]